MDRRVISLYLSLSLMLLFAGCASKKVASSSGDQSGQAKIEAIQPDAIKTVPLERSFDRPSGSPPSNLSLSPTTASDSNALGDVFFDYDRFQIRKDAMPVLDANAGWLRASGSKTDAAKQYLQDLGVPTSQLQITSYGEARPFCKQQNEDCYQQNRRAHFVTK